MIRWLLKAHPATTSCNEKGKRNWHPSSVRQQTAGALFEVERLSSHDLIVQQMCAWEQRRVTWGLVICLFERSKDDFRRNQLGRFGSTTYRSSPSGDTDPHAVRCAGNVSSSGSVATHSQPVVDPNAFCSQDLPYAIPWGASRDLQLLQSWHSIER